MDLLDLYGKPASYKFSDKELKFIKSRVPKYSMKVKYCIYRMKSEHNTYIGFIIDQDPGAWRKSAYMNQWEIIAERPLTGIEYNEVIQNFGTHHRRFIVWKYRIIEELIHEDDKYNVKTPEKFIQTCRERGYFGNYQTQIKFE